MDVNFPRTADSLDEDTLMQQMVECHHQLNVEYSDKKCEPIVVMMRKLQDYLNRNHPGLTVPLQGPLWKFVVNSLENFALLSLEYQDIGAKSTEYKDLFTVLLSKTKKGNFLKTSADNSKEVLREKKAILESMRVTLSAMTQTRLAVEKGIRELNLKYQKLKDLAKGTTTTDVVSGGEDDVLLGILRKGILSLMTQDDYENILKDFTSAEPCWQYHKENEDRMFGLIDDHMKVVEYLLASH